MIEVNLLPGGRKKTGKSMGFKLPKLSFGGGGDRPDPYLIFFGAALIVALAYAGWTFLGVRGDAEELAVRLEEERQDSLRFAAIIEQTNALTARRDSIAARAAIIQEIDADRYVWAHLMDEIGAAVPEYTWLREVTYVGDNPLTVRIAGRAGTTFAVTNFMRRLEASRFLSGAQLQDMQMQPSEVNQNDMVQVFELVVTYEQPPLEELETVPLFEESAAQVAAPSAN
ncbi:MAG: PilN domain-containing protein [Gemmatimonadales bacterium]